MEATLYKRMYFLLILMFTVVWRPVYGATLIVDQTGPDDGATAGTLRKAVNDAAPSDTIIFDFGGGIHTITLSDALTVDKDLTFVTTAGDSVQISGGDSNGVFIIDAGAVVIISDVTITNGRAESGGGIFNSGDLTLLNVSVINNSALGDNGRNPTGSGGGGGGAGFGGGIFNEGILTIEDSSISQNDADGGNGATGGTAAGTGGRGGGLNGGNGRGATAGGNGGFGGGGGGSGGNNGGNGGFGGGGGGGGAIKTGGDSGFGGGNGGNGGFGGAGGGGGGGGLGGGLFNDDTGTVSIRNTTISSNVATEGSGGGTSGNGAAGSDGESHGGGIFNRDGGIVTVHTNDLAGDVFSNTAETSGSDTFGTITVVPFPVIAVSGNLDFGPIVVGGTVEEIVTVSNTGDAVLDVSSTSITGADVDQFSVNTPFTVAPGTSHDVTVTFVPTSHGMKTANLEFTHNASGSPTSISLNGEGLGHVQLTFGEDNAPPGAAAVIPVTIDANVPVAGLEIDIVPEYRVNGEGPNLGPDIAELAGIINDIDHLSFTAAFSTDEEGVSTILVFSVGGEEIPVGELVILQLVYQLDPEVPAGTMIDLVVTEVIAADLQEQSIPVLYSDGVIHTGMPGDIAGDGGAGDGHVNVLDIIKEVRYILGTLPLLHPDDFDEPQDEQEEAFQARATFLFFLADVNGDNEVNVLDIVGMVNIILDVDPPMSKIADTDPAVAHLDAVQVGEDGRRMLPVVLDTDGMIAGVQFGLTFDAALLEVGASQLVGRAADMTMQTHLADGRLQVLVYSTTGDRIPAGKGVMLLIPLTLLEAAATPVVTLDDMMLADPQAQLVPVRMGNAVVQVKSIPTSFMLAAARPNPFNPNTTIAYDVPQQAHITLTVYNMLGQEVIRLVDMAQAPGRYTVTWNGGNAQGHGVASGVYMYRLTSLNGYNQTKRMTLLK